MRGLISPYLTSSIGATTIGVSWPFTGFATTHVCHWRASFIFLHRLPLNPPPRPTTITSEVFKIFYFLQACSSRQFSLSVCLPPFPYAPTPSTSSPSCGLLCSIYTFASPKLVLNLHTPFSQTQRSFSMYFAPDI